MHRSRVYALIIDVPEEAGAGAAAFWSGVFGTQARPSVEEPQFTSLPGAVAGITTALQAIEGQGRYHLDVETDDVLAEAERLRALGAVDVSTWLECHVLQAPGGHLLCVVPVAGDRVTFDAQARTWP